MRNLLLFALMLAGIGLVLAGEGQPLPLEWTAEYDRARHREIRGAIRSDPEHLARPFGEARRVLSLDDVPWDDGAIQQDSGLFRIYHYRGFSLHVLLRRLPAGITPSTPLPWNRDGQAPGREEVLWVADLSIRVDGLADGRERMRRYWRGVEEECERINAEMRRNHPEPPL